MSEYISREEAKKALGVNISITITSEHDLTPYAKEINELGKGIYAAQEAALDSIPPADVRPNIHGHWEKVKKGITAGEFSNLFKCSCCDCELYDNEFNFCPNCGADMREPTWEKGD